MDVSCNLVEVHQTHLVRRSHHHHPKRSLSLLRIKAHTMPPLNLSDLPLIGLDSQHDRLSEFLDRTIHRFESDSIFLLGPHASGKSKLINTVLDTVDPSKSLYRRLDLNGLIHTDEKSAFRALARQLAIEENYLNQSFYSSSHALKYILESLRRDNDAWLPLVVILDAMDQFISHPKQMLLYMILDLIQSQSNAIAVIGVTTQFNIVSELEKRVKSRFSHRYIVFPMRLSDENLERVVEHWGRVSKQKGIAHSTHAMSGTLVDIASIAMPPLDTSKYLRWVQINAPTSSYLTTVHLCMLASLYTIHTNSGSPVALIHSTYSTFAKSHVLSPASGIPIIHLPDAVFLVNQLVQFHWLALATKNKAMGLPEFKYVVFNVPITVIKEVVNAHPLSRPALRNWIKYQE